MPSIRAARKRESDVHQYRALFSDVEQRFRDVGFDGFVCGCGTDIYDGAEILHVAQTHETVKAALAAREWDIDILF